MMNIDKLRQQLSAVIEEIIALSIDLERRGIRCREPAEINKVRAILKRITERAYGGK